MLRHFTNPGEKSDRALTPTVGIAVLLSIVVVAGALLAVATTTSVQGEFDDAERAAGQQTVSGNQWSGSIGDLIRLSNSRAGASNVRARINFTIEAKSNVIGREFNSLTIHIQGGKSMLRETELASLQSVKVDADADGSTEQELTASATDWTVNRNGQAVTIDFDSTYNPGQDDSVILVFNDVTNPEAAGSYGVRARANGKGKWHHGSIRITQPVAPVG
jgi:hypothetical protein